MRRPILPTLARSHRGFFLVVVAEIFTHIGIGLDNVLRPYAYQGLTWSEMTHRAPITWWGTAHLTLAAVLIIGVYDADRLHLLFRGGLLLSVTLYMLSFGVILDGTLQPRPPTVVIASPGHYGPLYLPILVIFPLISSVAAFFEPAVNPASIRRSS